MRILSFIFALGLVIAHHLHAAEPQPELELSCLPMEIHHRILYHVVSDPSPAQIVPNCKGLYGTSRFWRDLIAESSEHMVTMVKKLYDVPRGIALLYCGIKKNRDQFLDLVLTQDKQEYDQLLNGFLFKNYDDSKFMKKVFTELIASRIQSGAGFSIQRPENWQVVLGKYYISSVSHYGLMVDQVRCVGGGVLALVECSIHGLIASPDNQHIAAFFDSSPAYDQYWGVQSVRAGSGDNHFTGSAGIPGHPRMEYDLIRCAFNRDGKPLLYYTFIDREHRQCIGIESTFIPRPEGLHYWDVNQYRIINPDQQ